MTFRDISYILLIKLVISMVLGIFDVIGVGLKQEKARKERKGEAVPSYRLYRRQQYLLYSIVSISLNFQC